MKAAVLRNPLSHRNRRARGEPASRPADTLYVELGAPEILDAALRDFAAKGVELLVVDGGDGTVREVLSRLSGAFPVTPRLAVAPSGKTNVLALDLGARPGWTAEAAIAWARANPGAVKHRSPLEVGRAGETGFPLKGFLFGAAAFARATALAQQAHAAGFFGRPAVALTMAAAVVHTLAGGPRDPWRTGEPITLGLDGAPQPEGRRFLVLASTLKRLPLHLKPFGQAGEGLRVLDIDAPPRRLWAALPSIAAGGESGWLAGHGYRRSIAQSLSLHMAAPFVLDGETYDGGEITVRRGAPLAFVAPPG